MMPFAPAAHLLFYNSSLHFTFKSSFINIINAAYKIELTLTNVANDKAKSTLRADFINLLATYNNNFIVSQHSLYDIRYSIKI